MAIAKLPRQILPNLYRFAPNRDTLGGTAYLLITPQGNVLVDCPGWDESIQRWLEDHGRVRWLCLTHRDGHSPKLKAIQESLGCQVIVQEQEAYLVPPLLTCQFQEQLNVSESIMAVWTTGHSPGSTCYYWTENGGILFTGRHLLPDGEGKLAPLRQPKTFHWPRQQASVRKIHEYVKEMPLKAICPGGNIGYLRGKDWVENPKTILESLVNSFTQKIGQA